MNKNDLIDAVTERTSLAKSDAARAVEAVLGSITEALQKGDTVGISGFGTFAVKTRAARASNSTVVVNARTGARPAGSTWRSQGRSRSRPSRARRRPNIRPTAGTASSRMSNWRRATRAAGSSTSRRSR